MHSSQSTPDIRKITVSVEDTYKDAGRAVTSRKSKVVVAAVISNPLAGEYCDDLESIRELGKNIGGLLAERGVQALSVAPNDIQSYGKGAIVGLAGELEHSAALLHPRFGAPVRTAVHEGKDIIPGTKKMGGPGASITLPMTQKNNIWDFDHMDSIEVCIADAPRDHEIVVALALGIGGRPLNRTHPD
ncbi:MAG: amino acid synthesis family protein [Pseudomonadota bacterium]